MVYNTFYKHNWNKVRSNQLGSADHFVVADYLHEALRFYGDLIQVSQLFWFLLDVVDVVVLKLGSSEEVVAALRATLQK